MGIEAKEIDMVYAIIADGELDQVVETLELAKREKKDLERMGCRVKIKGPMTWEEADKLEAKLRGE